MEEIFKGGALSLIGGLSPAAIEMMWVLYVQVGTCMYVCMKV